jgi:hypothetical protein
MMVNAVKAIKVIFNSNIEDYVANVPAAIAPRHWILEKKADRVLEDIVKRRDLIAGYLTMRK